MNATRQHRRARAAPAGSRRLVLRSPKGGGGFTLVEMLAVIAVMGVLFAVAVIGFSAFGRGARLRSASQIISRHLTYARQLAMTRRAVYGVEFDKTTPPTRPQQQFRVYGYDDHNRHVTVGKWIELPLGIKYGDKEGHAAQDPPDEIEFEPTGRASAPSGDLEFSIHDVDSGKERVIEVVPVTGQAKVSIPPPD